MVTLLIVESPSLQVNKIIYVAVPFGLIEKYNWERLNRRLFYIDFYPHSDAKFYELLEEVREIYIRLGLIRQERTEKGIKKDLRKYIVQNPWKVNLIINR